MIITISFTPIKYYNIKNIIQWIWYFRRYKNVKGFIFRIFGIYFNIREKNSFAKISKLIKEKSKQNYEHN